MSSSRDRSSNGSRKTVVAEHEHRKQARDIEQTNKQAAAMNAAKAAAATGSTDSVTPQSSATEKQKPDGQEDFVMLEMAEAQESFLTIQRAATPSNGTPVTPPLQLKAVSPYTLSEGSQNAQNSSGEKKEPAPDLTPAMMVDDKPATAEVNDPSPFSDSQQASDHPLIQEVIPPEETEQERKLNEAAVKAVLQADAEERDRLQSQSPTPTGSSASQAARKLEEAKAASQLSQSPSRTCGLPDRPSPPSRQNSNATSAGASGASTAQQPTSSSSYGSSFTSTSWNPVAAIRGSLGSQRTGALNVSVGSGSLQQDLQIALKEVKALREEKRTLTSALHDQQNYSKRQDNQLQVQHSQMQQLYRELQNATSEADRYKRLLGQAREQFAAIEAERLKFATQLSETSKLLESRTLELRTAETFLTKYDDTPGDEVVGIVNDINSQVLNIGGKIAEEITEAFSENSSKDTERKIEVEAVNELQNFVGEKLVNILLKSNFMEDPTPVQLAVQSMLVNGIYTILLSWPMSPTNTFSGDFWDLYKSILRSEVQPVASRWRALGCKHYRQNGAVDLHRYTVDGLLVQMSKILYVAGVHSSDHHLQDFVRNCVGQSVDVLWKTSDAFAQKIREHVHSTDYELLFVAPGETYDSQVMRAQGAHPPPRKGEKGRGEGDDWRVLCTTDLGLRRITNRGKPGDKSPKLDMEVMNKAVVIFEHELDGM